MKVIVGQTKLTFFFQAIKTQARFRGGTMKNRKLSVAVVVVFLALVIGFQRWEQSSIAASVTGRQTKPANVDFIKEVQPIFQTSCYGCHGSKRERGGLRLDSKKSALAKVIVPGKSSESALYQRIAGIGEQARMPLGKEALKPEQIATIKNWIDQGAEWPEGDSSQGRSGEGELKKHWAFVKPSRPELPQVKNKAWVRTPIDQFVLARLEKEGLAPSPEA